MNTDSLCACSDGNVPPVQDTDASGQQQSFAQPVRPVIDPSGFVYEAVPSNRLTGVTATLYQDRSDTGSDVAEWDAGEYDQDNPLTTDLNGQYSWFVPAGLWQVRFEKNGYEARCSDWLPVPPPQMDINVGMISTSAPMIGQSAAYTDRVEVEFSQYMNIDSVKSALSLTQNGTVLSGCNVVPLDAEYNLENTVQYATRFAIAPSGGELTGGLIVFVNDTAQNYAGTRMTEPYTSPTMTVSVRPTGIAAPETVSIIPYKTAAVTAVLQPGIAGQELTIDNLSPALLAIDDQIITTGADGSIRIALTGLLPGSGVIRITDPVSGLSKTVDVQVGAVEEVPPVVSVAPVTAVLEDGTAVTSGMTIPSGAKIRLQTQTAGAVIRYTLNDTYPCKETADVYQTPIVITADTVLRAAAYKDGTYSSTIRLELKAAAPSHTHNWSETWNNDAIILSPKRRSARSAFG